MDCYAIKCPFKTERDFDFGNLLVCGFLKRKWTRTNMSKMLFNTCF